MKTYRVEAHWDEGWWGLYVPEVPGALSQVKRLEQAEDWIREPLGWMLDVPEDSFDFEIVPEIEDWHGLDWVEVRQRRQAAETELAAAREQQRLVVEQMREKGMSMRDIGALLDISYQRAAQVAAEAREAYAAG